IQNTAVRSILKLKYDTPSNIVHHEAFNKLKFRVSNHDILNTQLHCIEAKPVNWEAKSKIGSLEKYNYEPGGGQVSIESRPCNWEAKSKIGSLEKANYVPPGGNVKITNYKLNWQARSKIGSLEKANHTPLGGNVKIPSFKIDFREKARPKTDTGLIIIEDFDENLSISSDLINQSLQSLTGSN
ncbi:microtubule-associated 4-like, partial [Brachionus plicatilis]